VIARAVVQGKILVVPAVYSLSTGKVDFQDAVRSGSSPSEAPAPGGH
jgi:hypothetical protein